MKYYTDDSFLKSGKHNVSYGFFTRLGGHSYDVYKGLNCGFGSNDESQKVAKNRSDVAQSFNVSPENLLSLYQIHGNIVHILDAPWSDRPQGDGFVTDKAGIALGILTADCAPVLFYGLKGDKSPVIGAAHAGWGGALKGVLDKTVSQMQEVGAVKETIRACVGPCISKSSYEVTDDFVEPFLQENDGAENFFFSGAKEGHLMFDLSGYCAWRLFRIGIKNIAVMDKDTYKNEEEFYSYRRATHNKDFDYGRQISVISIGCE